MSRNRIAMFILFITLFTGVLAGCSTGGNDSKENVKTSIKVMYYDERSFYQQYGMLFAAMNPNIEIEVVSTQSVRYEEGKDMKKAMQDFLDEQKPDVLMLSTEEYKRMAGEGKLYNLESFIKKDKYDLEGIAPGIIDYIKQQSDGVLYGLSPNFYSQALFYNKDLFTKYGVPFPEDRMSWESVLQLAARFPTTGTKENRIYGLKPGYNPNLYYFGLSIGSSQGLSYINPTTKQMTINTDSWKAAFELADKAMKSGALYTEDPNGQMTQNSTYESYLLRDPFISGKVAMTMEGNYIMDQLKEAKNVLKDKGIKNWDVVTVPVNPQQPDESTGMSINQIFSIDAKSSNTDAAWKFISYVNGDEFARVTSKVQNGGFPARTKYLDNGEGHHMEAFYSLKPVQSNMYKDFDKLPQDFFQKFDGVTQQEMQGVTDGKTTIADALDNIQAKGQQLLTEESNKAGKDGKTDPQPSESSKAVEQSSGVTSSAVAQ
ncbi:ABC transporter substrate-binding protein [Cohnella silvisoli]|uniref:Extracellular solute-binding protein n=1 Tax=Cohnella silvisoli TaxID=2873699 RepID=A0ABV1KR93_9BACL|nr:extracellular solute-binding protein [Cohnella silvisoli]MCD9022200.1 extracellular solute-binding protein [Cohnella silvisoli]